jgi:hypothetical protein
VHHLQQGFFLRNLCDERNPICPPTTVERIEGKPVMRERLERPSTAVGKASGGAPSPRTPPAVEVLAGAPPPSDESAWEALTRWINGGGWLGGDGSVLGQICTG